MLKSAKQGILSAIQRCGGLGFVAASGWRHRRVLILAYHGVSLKDEHLWDGNLYMSPEVLEERFALIKSLDYNVISLQEALRGLKDGKLPARSVVLTFDDGFYDFYAVGAPLLRKYGYPATLYVTTYYSVFNRPIFRLVCSYLLWQKRCAVVELTGFAGWSGTADLSVETTRAALLSRITCFATEKKLSASAKDDLAAALAARLGIDYGTILRQRLLHLVNEAELQELTERGVDVQLHTHRHRTPGNRELFMREIEDNRSCLQRIAGLTANDFCYPSGVHDSTFLSWLQQANVLSATTCDAGLASARSNPLLLPRIVDHGGLSAVEFESWLAGVSSFVPHRRLRTRIEYD